MFFSFYCYKINKQDFERVIKHSLYKNLSYKKNNCQANVIDLFCIIFIVILTLL